MHGPEHRKSIHGVSTDCAAVLHGDVAWCCCMVLHSGVAMCCMTVLQIAPEAVQRVKEQLQGANIVRIKTLRIVSHEDSEPTSAALRASIQMLSALPCKPREVVIEGWPASPACVAELGSLKTIPALQSHLPKSLLCLYLSTYGEALDDGEVWPLARAPWLLPASFRVWALDAAMLQHSELRACVLNAPADRTAEAPLTIELQNADPGWVDDLRARMESLGTYPHVRVVAV